MKKKWLVAAALAAAASMSAAHADSSGAFVQGSAGQARNSGHGEFAYGITGGYRWTVAPSFYLGLEGGYQDLGNRKFSGGYAYQFADMTGASHSISTSYRSKAATKALLLGANAKWDMTDNFFVLMRAGVARYRLKASVTAYGTFDGDYDKDHFTRSTYSTRYYAGVGAGYHLTPQLDLQITYDHFAPRFNHTTVGTNLWAASMEYRF